MTIRVAIVDDDGRFRECLANWINAEPGFACVAACVSSEQALEQLPAAAPNVVLMDMHLPSRSGIECVATLRSRAPQIQVIMLTIEENSERVFESLKAGAVGYLVKHTPPAQILEAIRELFRGGAPMSSHIARQVVVAFRQPPAAGTQDLPVSPREAQLLQLLAKGYRSKEIADEMDIAISTVNTHIRHIYEKLHVRSRAEAVARLPAKPRGS